jgi:hypothetical protein
VGACDRTTVEIRSELKHSWIKSIYSCVTLVTNSNVVIHAQRTKKKRLRKFQRVDLIASYCLINYKKFIYTYNIKRFERILYMLRLSPSLPPALLPRRRRGLMRLLRGLRTRRELKYLWIKSNSNREPRRT